MEKVLKTGKVLLFTMVIMFVAGALFADLNSDLAAAAKKGNLDEVKILIAKGADINT